MPNTTIVFGILLSTLYGAIFHLIRGGSTKMMLLSLLLAWAGFWLGDTLGWYLGWSFAAIGNLNAGTGSISCLIFMLAGDLINRMRNTSDAK